ncbi:MAG: TIGR04540 family protein [Sarcina sp.]
MRARYRNPKELAIAVKDQIDLYQENLMEYDKLKVRIVKIAKSSEDVFYKNEHIAPKLVEVLGEDRLAIIKEILE